MSSPPRSDIRSDERLIFALDVPAAKDARELVARLGDAVRFYKLGLELAMTGDYFALVDELLAAGKRLFLDLKLYDIPETVARSVRVLAERTRGARGLFLTVHAVDPVLRAACREKRELQILAVTVLTSFGRSDLQEQGYRRELQVSDVVNARARRAAELGCDGVIASGQEAARLRALLGPGPLIVTPGIRLAGGAVGGDDQKRVVTPADALRAGADHVVVGRPIRDAADPREAALGIQREIAAALPGSG